MENYILKLSAAELVDQIKSKKISSVETAKAFIGRVKTVEPKIKAFVTVLEKEALEAAKKVDEKIARGESTGCLAGVPIAIKDNMMITGVPTTCSSKILNNYIAPYDATVIEKLVKEDAVFIGKTNLDEFAMGSSTENSAFAATRNPWNTDYIPGGSSGNLDQAGGRS